MRTARLSNYGAPGLTLRDRSMVTIATDCTQPDDRDALSLHPRVMAKDVFAYRKIGADQLPPAEPALLPLNKEGEAQRAANAEQQFGNVAGDRADTTDVLFLDL